MLLFSLWGMGSYALQSAASVSMVAGLHLSVCFCGQAPGSPTDYRTGLVHRRALDLYRSIPAQHHREVAVRDLRDVLAA